MSEEEGDAVDFCRTKQNAIWLQHRKTGTAVAQSRRFYKYFQFSVTIFMET